MRCSTSIVVLLASGISLSVRAGPVQVASESGVDADVGAGKSLRTTPYTELVFPATNLGMADPVRLYPEPLVGSSTSPVVLPIPIHFHGAPVGDLSTEDGISLSYSIGYNGWWASTNEIRTCYSCRVPDALTGRRISITSMCVVAVRSGGNTQGISARLRVSHMANPTGGAGAGDMPTTAALVMVAGSGTRNSAGVPNTTSTPDLSGGGENSGNCVRLDDGTGAVIVEKAQIFGFTAIGTSTQGASISLNGFIY